MFQLSSERDKLRLLAATGLDGAIVMTFDAALGRHLGGGFHRAHSGRTLRHRRRGDRLRFPFRAEPRRLAGLSRAEQGARLGFAVDIVPPLEDEGRPVSSGAVRAALAAGKVVEATELLGAPWFVSGEVIHGDKRGRELGFPTANLRLDPSCGLKHGIYAVRVGVGDKRHDGVASFGVRPMFDDGAPLLEVFLFDFDGDLYGQTIDVAFIGWIRHEQKFVRHRDPQAPHDGRCRAGPRRAQARRQGVSEAGGGLAVVIRSSPRRRRPIIPACPYRQRRGYWVRLSQALGRDDSDAAFPPRNPPAKHPP